MAYEESEKRPEYGKPRRGEGNIPLVWGMIEQARKKMIEELQKEIE